MRTTSIRIWTGRVLIGLVFLFNIQCAVAFLLFPERYSGGFELSGTVGSGMVRGFGILFLMWNVPYGFALSDPIRRRVSLFEAIAMQFIGFAGETILLWSFPSGHAVIRETIGRFIIFDGAGLLALVLAAAITAQAIHQPARTP